MISLCTVIINGMDKFLEILSESICKKTKLISEVVIAVINGNNKEVKWEERNIKFQKFNCHLEQHFPYHHALGLHECIERANNKYIMMCDPDIFFANSIDEIYLDTINRYNLDFIGISHHAATNQAALYFPYIMNILVEKSALPNNDFLKNHLRIRPTILRSIPEPDEANLQLMNGKYLLTGPIEKYINNFPNKNQNCIFDVGCNLYLWSEQQKWKWLSFQTLDCHWYTTTYFRSNVKNLKIPPKQKLLYHNVAGAIRGPDEIEKIYKMEQ